MKKRLGFVSNSSSSSFCIYGIEIAYSEIAELLKIEEEQISDTLDRLEIVIENDYENESAYFGLSYSDLRDDETGAQFKQRALEALIDIFGEKAKEWKLQYINEEIYN